MATHVAGNFDGDLFYSSLADGYSVPETASGLFEYPAFTKERDGLHVSTTNAIRGATGAMVAIGIEAVAAVGVYGLWRLLFR